MSYIVEWYRDLMDNKHDPRTQELFLVSSLVPVLTIVGTYLYFCVSAGPRYMKDQKPYDLRNTLIIYNFIQVLLSLYLVYEGLIVCWLCEYNLICQPLNYSFKPNSVRMANVIHLYFMCKLIELLDTVFFVLRKRSRQITFLHLYHHSMMPVFMWIIVKFYAGGNPVLSGLINSFIHVFMYIHYLLSAFGPRMQKYLWWKKYMTAMQIVQFIIVFFHNFQMLFNSCNSPKPLSFLFVFNSGLFIYMFGLFYISNYLKSNVRRESKANDTTNGAVSINGNTNSNEMNHGKAD